MNPRDRDRYEDRAVRPALGDVRAAVAGTIVDLGALPDPTGTGSAVYAVRPFVVSADESEGAAATTSDSEGYIYALLAPGNVARPKAGDVVVCHPIPGARWAFTVGTSVSRKVKVTVRVQKGIMQGGSSDCGGPDYDPGAGDGTRFRLFAYWAVDGDTGAATTTGRQCDPGHIDEKYHIYLGQMDDAPTQTTPNPVDGRPPFEEWTRAYREFDVDETSRPSGVTYKEIALQVVDVHYDLPLDVSTVVTIYDGGNPAYDAKDYNVLISYSPSKQRGQIQDQLTWYCPAYRYGCPDVSISSVGSHSFAGVAASVSYPVGYSTFGADFVLGAKVVTIDTQTDGAPHGFWWKRLVGWTVQAGFDGDPMGTQPGPLIVSNQWSYTAPGYVPESATFAPSPFSDIVVLHATVCATSYGYISSPLGPVVPDPGPGCIPPKIFVSIDKTGVADMAMSFRSGDQGDVPNSCLDVDLESYFGDYAGGAPVELNFTGSASYLGLFIYNSYVSGCLVNKKLGVKTKFEASTGGIFPAGGFSTNFYQGGALGNLGLVTGVIDNNPGCLTPNTRWSSGADIVLPVCTGSRPTSGPIYLSSYTCYYQVTINNYIFNKSVNLYIKIGNWHF